MLINKNYMNKKCIENTRRARLDMEFLLKCSTPFLTGERSERVRYRVEHQQLIGDFQAHVKNYRNTNSPSQESFHHQQFINLLPGYIVGAGGFIKCDVVSDVFT